METKELIALDAEIVRESVRERDKNGYLNVRTSKLTRDQVAPYYGREIPNWQSLGLDPERIYYGWRHPEELQRGLETFNGKPLLIKHRFDSAENPNVDIRVGTVGTSAQWEAPYITNALSVWDEKAIAAIEDGSLRDLSCGYRYKPDFTPGETPDGLAYDFVMRDIACNHVALVREGRADGCYVEDALPEGMKMEPNENKGGACDDFTDFARKVIGGANTGLSPEAVNALVAAFAAAHQKFEAAKAAAAGGGAPAEADDEDAPAENPPAENPAPKEGEDEDAPAEAEDEDKDAEAADEEEKPAPGAQDAAIIAKTVKAELRALYRAADDVKSVIGGVDPLAYDSANAIYLDALKQMRYGRKVAPSEAKAVFLALQSVRNPVGAADEKSVEASSSSKSFLDKYF